MNIFKKLGKMINDFGNRKAPPTNVVDKVPEAPKPAKVVPTELPEYQKAQRHWDERLANSHRYLWVSHRWVQFNEKLMILRKKTLRVLNTDGSVKAIAVGKTYRRASAA